MCAFGRGWPNIDHVPAVRADMLGDGLSEINGRMIARHDDTLNAGHDVILTESCGVLTCVFVRSKACADCLFACPRVGLILETDNGVAVCG